MTIPARHGATRLVLVRHTEPAEEVVGRCYGSLDVPLSEAGHAHAHDLARRLAALDVALVLTSPRIRAVDTAAPIARAHGLVAECVDALRELDFGAIEGRTYDDVQAELPELWEEWMTRPTEVTFPGGESHHDLRVRVGEVVDRVRRSHALQTVVLVTHGGVVRTIVVDALGMPPEHLFRLDQRHGAVNVIDWFDDTPVVRIVNG
jgi:broad specificity phosphatase PhoE